MSPRLVEGGFRAPGVDSNTARRRAGLTMVALLGASLLTGCGYGRIQELEEQVAVARSEIEVQMQRRAELVPVLLETVEGYAVVGGDVIAALADARARLVPAVRSRDLAAIERVSGELSSVLEQLLAGAGGVPELRADPSFRLLRSQLEGTEEQVNRAGHSYNDAVRRYNEYIAGFPQMVTAKVIGARRLELFEPSWEPASPSSVDE